MSTLSHHNTHFNETTDILQNGPHNKCKNKNRLMAVHRRCQTLQVPSVTPPASQKKDTLYIMVPRETVSFVFPRVLMFPETKSRETSGLKGKQN